MIKIIQNMPAGTIGLEAVGKVTDDDYRDVLMPAISAALERNDVRLLYVLSEDFRSYSPGAVWADTKLWAQHHKAWQKIAIVSDADWLENSVEAFGWLIPGEIKSLRPMISTMPKNGCPDPTTKTTSARAKRPKERAVKAREGHTTSAMRTELAGKTGVPPAAAPRAVWPKPPPDFGR